MLVVSLFILSIGKSWRFGYNNGASIIGTCSRGKSLCKIFQNIVFISALIGILSSDKYFKIKCKISGDVSCKPPSICLLSDVSALIYDRINSGSLALINCDEIFLKSGFLDWSNDNPNTISCTDVNFKTRFNCLKKSGDGFNDWK